MAEEIVTLWRPVGPAELALIRASGMRAFPPRLPGQPIFYPVLSEEYAIRIARDWNAPASRKGYVTRFRVAKAFLSNYEVHEAGGQAHCEYWIPAEDLAGFNAALAGENRGDRGICGFQLILDPPSRELVARRGDDIGQSLAIVDDIVFNGCTLRLAIPDGNRARGFEHNLPNRLADQFRNATPRPRGGATQRIALFLVKINLDLLHVF